MKALNIVKNISYLAFAVFTLAIIVVLLYTANILGMKYTDSY